MRLPWSAIIIGGVGIAAVVIWLAARDRSATTPEVASGSTRGGSAGRGAMFAPEGPRLGSGGAVGEGAGGPGPVLVVPAAETGPATVAAPPRTGPDPSAVALFQEQTRDPEWASNAEGELRRRLARLRVPVDQIECRHDRCEVMVGGTEVEVSDGLAKLDGSKGLADFATAIVLTAPEQRDGRLTVRAYALIER